MPDGGRRGVEAALRKGRLLGRVLRAVSPVGPLGHLDGIVALRMVTWISSMFRNLTITPSGVRPPPRARGGEGGHQLKAVDLVLPGPSQASAPVR